MATLDDILTTQKNGVTAINGVLQSNLRNQGTATSATVTADTLVIAGRGYLVAYTVIVAGSTEGAIHNTNAITGVLPANKLVVVPNTVGYTKIGHAFNSGLVIKIGSGQSINITYFVGG
jgi:hypothetical protein